MSRIIFIAIFCVLGVTITYIGIQSKEQKVLPIINPVDVDPQMVDDELLRVGRGHKIGKFSFKNQNGKTITEAAISDKIVVAEYFFTTCGTICPKMNRQLQRVQEAYSNTNDVKLLSFTVNPEVDDVKRMNEYAALHNANASQWWFLTGSKEELYALARTSFFVLKPAEAKNLGDVGSDFIHTNNFVLVDKQKRIRGYYDGTSTEEVDKLIQDIQHLLSEH